MDDLTIQRGAVLSRCGQYRYHLWRSWASDAPRLLLIMLNPSLADHRRDDLTITKSIAIARRLGYGRLDVANLAALRTPHPADLARAADPVGPYNDRHLARLLRDADHVICAWGAHAARLPGRVHAVQRLIRRSGKPVQALKLTNDGHPSHPLARGKGFIPIAVQPVPFAV